MLTCREGKSQQKSRMAENADLLVLEKSAKEQDEGEC